MHESKTLFGLHRGYEKFLMFFCSTDPCNDLENAAKQATFRINLFNYFPNAAKILSHGNCFVCNSENCLKTKHVGAVESDDHRKNSRRTEIFVFVFDD